MHFSTDDTQTGTAAGNVNEQRLQDDDPLELYN